MEKVRRPTKADQEIDAIGAILKALDGLEGASIRRVLDYVFSRLSLSGSAHLPVPSSSAASVAATGQDLTPTHRARQADIRSLKEEKFPESSNQMAALVAYYLSDIAPESEHKDSINTADIEKYFKQAGFKLPKALVQTLKNAAAAGYLDAMGGGYYKLNPVGYNLIVHGLPRSHGAEPKVRRGKGKSRSARRSS